MIEDLRLHAPASMVPRRGEYVLYWMQGVTLRAHDNFALNHAVEEANRLGLPVLVYHGLRHDYPWASDRIHTFILESALDLRADFAERGLQYAFYLDTRPRAGAARARRGAGTGSPLLALAERAALVVTDFFPTFIQPRQLRGLRSRAEVPVVAVESATVVPLRALDRAWPTARGIRPRLMELLPHHLHRVGDVEPRIRRRVEIPWDAVGWPERGRDGAAWVRAQVARCDIDHGVAPSPVLRGGPRAARARLDAFLADGVERYAAERGDPNAGASSRLSPWLHFGNISMQEVLLTVRKAATGDNWSRFLDEALTWRELAHNFVFHEARHRTWSAVPEWARRELEDHAGDPRPALYPDRVLEAADTGDELWNAAQRSLLRDGELHNYVRMLWGKALLQWTRTPRHALRILEHLNHKYALDGRDPNSYGGILWCFGKFDRPFYRRPVYGTVRYMSTRAARDKFDVPRYLASHSESA